MYFVIAKLSSNDKVNGKEVETCVSFGGGISSSNCKFFGGFGSTNCKETLI